MGVVMICFVKHSFILFQLLFAILQWDSMWEKLWYLEEILLTLMFEYKSMSKECYSYLKQREALIYTNHGDGILVKI